MRDAPYVAFDPKIVAAATRRADTRLRFLLLNPHPLATYPCPKVSHGLSVQRGGPTPAVVASPLLSFATPSSTPPHPKRRRTRRGHRVRRSH